MKIILPFLFFFNYAQAQEAPGEFYIDQWGGLNNFFDSQDIPDSDAQSSINILTDRGYLEKRTGNIRAATVLANNAVKYLKEFIDSSNNRWLLAHSSTTLYRTNFSGGITSITTMSASGILDSVTGFNRHYFVNGVDTPFYWNGTSTAAITGAPAGAKLVEFDNERLILANTTAGNSRVHVSSYGSDNDWTVPATLTIQPDAPNLFTFGRGDDEGIECLAKTPWGVYIGKPHSSHVLKGYNNNTYYKRLVHPRIGCEDDRSFQMGDQEAYWLGNDGIYSWDGANPPVKISQEIEPLVLLIQQISGGKDSWTTTTKSEFNQGTTTLNGTRFEWDSERIDGSLINSTFTLTDTSTTDFNLGTIANTVFRGDTIPSISTMAPPGSVSLAVSTVGAGGWGGERDPGDSCGTDGNSWTTSALGEAEFFCDGNTSNPLLGSKSLSFVYCDDPGDSIKQFTLEVRKASDASLLISSAITSNLSLTAISTVSLASLTNVSSAYIRLTTSDGAVVVSSETFYIGRNLITHYRYRPYSESNTTFANCLAAAGANDRALFVDFPFEYNQRVEGGTFTSRSFDTRMSTPAYGGVDWTSVSNSSNSLTVRVQTSTDDVTWVSLEVSTDGSKPSVSNYRYIRYVATFTSVSNIDLSSPAAQLDDLTFSAISTGVYASSVREIGNATSFGNFNATVDDTLSRISFQVRSASSAISVLSSTPDWTNQTNNQVVAVSTNQWVQWRAISSVQSPTETARVDQVILNWFEGSTLPVASAFHEGRYFLSVTTSPNSTVNDTTLVYQKNKKWTLFNGPLYASLAIYDNKLYAGDASTSSYVWETMKDDVYNDDGAAISSEWITKDWIFGKPHNQKKLHDLWLEAKFTTNTILSVGYAVDKSNDFTSSNVNLGVSSTTINRRVPVVDGFALGKYYKFKISNSQKDQYFRFNSLGGFYNLEPLRFDDD